MLRVTGWEEKMTPYVCQANYVRQSIVRDGGGTVWSYKGNMTTELERLTRLSLLVDGMIECTLPRKPDRICLKEECQCVGASKESGMRRQA